LREIWAFQKGYMPPCRDFSSKLLLSTWILSKRPTSANYEEEKGDCSMSGFTFKRGILFLRKSWQSR
jgi:hypothetical protein